MSRQHVRKGGAGFQKEPISASQRPWEALPPAGSGHWTGLCWALSPDGVTQLPCVSPFQPPAWTFLATWPALISDPAYALH